MQRPAGGCARREQLHAQPTPLPLVNSRTGNALYAASQRHQRTWPVGAPRRTYQLKAPVSIPTSSKELGQPADVGKADEMFGRA